MATYSGPSPMRRVGDRMTRQPSTTTAPASSTQRVEEPGPRSTHIGSAGLADALYLHNNLRPSRALLHDATPNVRRPQAPSATAVASPSNTVTSWGMAASELGYAPPMPVTATF